MRSTFPFIWHANDLQTFVCCCSNALDYVVSQASVFGVKLILTLTNYYVSLPFIGASDETYIVGACSMSHPSERYVAACKIIQLLQIQCNNAYAA